MSKIESLEPRRLMSSTIAEMQFPTEWPAIADNPGKVTRIGRTLHVRGTDAGENITIASTTRTMPGTDFEAEALIEINIGSNRQVFFPGRIRRVLINAAGGNDTVTINTNVPKTFHPRVLVIRGGDGNDTLNGSKRGDVILGEEGADTLAGGDGRDILIGGNGNDTITGNAGADRFYGGAGDDRFLNAETDAEKPSGTRDILDGGIGSDTAQVDPTDRRLNIENNAAA